MAVGNPFGLGGNSVTVGVVSFMGRDIRLEDPRRGTSVEMIQTDAAINPGNSGGPLLNTRGEVIGINTMIMTGGSQASAGVGFSVPINVAREILPQLREKGKVVRGWMGVNINPVSEDLAATYGLSEGKGAYVSAVTPGLPRGEGGPAAGGRDPLRRHAHHPGQQRPLALHLLEEPGRDGQARDPARQGEEGGLRDPRHLPGRERRDARPRTAGAPASA